MTTTAPARPLAAVLTTAGTFRVHAEGCADLAKPAGRQTHTPLPVRGATRRAIAAELWADIIDEGGMRADEAADYVDFLPCCGSVPEGDEAAEAPADETPVKLNARQAAALAALAVDPHAKVHGRTLNWLAARRLTDYVDPEEPWRLRYAARPNAAGLAALAAHRAAQETGS